MMSTLEDVRVAVRDVITPEIRTLTVKVDNLEKTVEQNAQALRHSLDSLRGDLTAHLASMDKGLDRLDGRINSLQQSMDTRLAAIQNSIEQFQNSLLAALTNEAARTRPATTKRSQRVVPRRREPPEPHKGGLER